MQPDCLIPLEDLVAGLAGDAELLAHSRHLLAVQQAGDDPCWLIRGGPGAQTFPLHLADREIGPCARALHCPSQTVNFRVAEPRARRRSLGRCHWCWSRPLSVTRSQRPPVAAILTHNPNLGTPEPRRGCTENWGRPRASSEDPAARGDEHRLCTGKRRHEHRLVRAHVRRMTILAARLIRHDVSTPSRRARADARRGWIEDHRRATPRTAPPWRWRGRVRRCDASE